MILKSLTKLIPQFVRTNKNRKCHSVFDFKEILQPERAEQFTVHSVTRYEREMALDVIKRHYLPEHVFVRTRKMDLDDRALDEYLASLLKQGNTLYARTRDGVVAGVCVNFASSLVDPKNLRLFAYYRQDPNVKDFLCFIAKLQETPNLWEVFQQKKIFEVKMLTVLPEYRRQGVAVSLVERSKEQALEQGYQVVRMDCINPYDYKVAERCMLQCVVKFPLHNLRGPHAPYVKRGPEPSRCVRVYVDARACPDKPECNISRERRQDLESLIK